MAPEPDFDVAAVHRYFAAECFNRAWELMDKSDRTPAEDRLMVALNQASIFHWLQRDDCDDQRLSVGFWQASRIRAMLGNPAEAVRQGEVCLSYSEALEPFFHGYACEALARAHMLAGNDAAGCKHLEAAFELADGVRDEEERELLLEDLRGLQAGR